ncbi:Senecionine N-oxygenase [Dispira parvispora]|uniref:glutaminase n=1 Tax=Dispira parvispora TaxID=1520584 RepID=A0A9W8AQE4_9FUNG|nr:Senecionine N-oxygenase [Dispira parvispora]
MHIAEPLQYMSGASCAPVSSLRLGVLAVQGAFQEHVHILNALLNTPVQPLGLLSGETTTANPPKATSYTLDSVQLVRTPEELAAVDGLIIPGGESTTMALIAERSGLWEPLVEFTRQKPTWGTCAGLILLASQATGTKQGGQRLLQSLDIHVQRNRFGSQLGSFEAELDAPCLKMFGEMPFRAVFIRAPIVTHVGSSAVKVLAEIPAPHTGVETVAVQQGYCLATAFHPELTSDDRWHRYFLALVAQYKYKLPNLQN